MNALLHWLRVFCEVVGAIALIISFGIIAGMGCWLLGRALTSRRRARRINAQIDQHMKAYRARIREQLLTHPLHVAREATLDELLPNVVELDS